MMYLKWLVLCTLLFVLRLAMLELYLHIDTWLEERNVIEIIYMSSVCILEFIFNIVFWFGSASIVMLTLINILM